MTRTARLLPFLLASLPAAALAESPTPAIPVQAVPAYAVAPPGMAEPLPAPIDLAVPAPDGELTGIARRVQDDRAAERSYFTPTALVAPRGTTTLSVQAPLFPMANIRLDRSFSDRLSLGVGVLGVIADDQLIGVGSLHGKYQVWRGRRAAVAATLSIYNVPEDDDGDETLTVPLPGVVGSWCASDECKTLVSVDLQAVANVDDEVLPIVGGVAIAHGKRRQLLAEFHTTEAEGDRLWFGFVGGRFLGRKLAFDAGFGFAGFPDSTATVDDCIDFCESSSSSTWIPYPFVALSSRL